MLCDQSLISFGPFDKNMAQPFHVMKRLCRYGVSFLLLLCCFPGLVEGGAGKSIEETNAARVAIFFAFFIFLSVSVEVRIC